MNSDILFHAESVLCDLHVSSKKQLFQEMASKLIEADALADSGIAMILLTSVLLTLWRF